MIDNSNSKECEICEKNVAIGLRIVRNDTYTESWEVCHECKENFKKITFTKPTEYISIFEPTIKYFEWLKTKYDKIIVNTTKKLDNIINLQQVMIADEEIEQSESTNFTKRKRIRKNRIEID